MMLKAGVMDREMPKFSETITMRFEDRNAQLKSGTLSNF